jgi:glutaredoxin 3
MAEEKQAVLYKKDLPNHTCPFGLRAKQLLEEHGYEVEDAVLATRQETDAFQAEHDVRTTPQVFTGGKRIGGSDELARHLAST